MTTITLSYYEYIEATHGTIISVLLQYLVNKIGPYDGIGGPLQGWAAFDTILVVAWRVRDARLLATFCDDGLIVEWQDQINHTFWTWRTERYEYADPEFLGSIDAALSASDGAPHIYRRDELYAAGR